MDIHSLLPNLLFTLGPKSRVRYKVELGDEQIIISADGEDEKRAKKLNYEDIVGFNLHVNSSAKLPTTSNKPVTMPVQNLSIFSYPPIKTLFSSKCTRKRVCTMLGLNCLDSEEKNIQALSLLKDYISQRILPQPPSSGDAAYVRFAKPLLILLNPASGKGQAKKLFKDKITPMLQEAGVDFTCLETERAGHGEEIARSADLSLYSGIVIVSGDGLVYEVYQGLMSREDSTQAVRFPVGVLPAGSGNALCCSVNYCSGEPFLYDMLIHSTYILLKHTIRPMDLVAIDTIKGRKYSFLSVTWGLVADIDIESERFRNLGNARFTVEAIYRILSPRTYRGKLSFLPNSPYVQKGLKGRSKTVVDIISEQPQSHTAGKARSASTPTSRSVPELSTPAGPTTNLKDDTTGSSIGSLSGDDKVTSARNSDESLTSNSSKTNREVTPAEGACDENIRPPTNENGISTANGSSHDDVFQDPTVNGKGNLSGSGDVGSTSEFIDMPQLSDPVPKEWVTIEDNFVSVIAAYQSHLGPELMAAPAATMMDGLIYLLIMRAPVTRMQMLNLMGQFETGSHVNNPRIELVAVKAFRLEPQAEEGNLVVDGEKVDFGPIQGRIMPAAARIMTK